MKRQISVVVTTLDNAATLPELLASVGFADEILVLDSGSSDSTVAIAEQAGARVLVQPFLGYGPQKQRAIDLATHDWVLLLDADEWVSPALARRIADTCSDAGTPTMDAWRIARRERMFWRWQHPASRHNHHLRLFDRRRTRMGDDPIHAAPECAGTIGTLDEPLMHWGEPDIHTKTEKINRYSSGMAARRARKPTFLLALRLVFYPPLVLLKQFVLKRHFLNGWAGWIHSVSMAHYSFLKDAKALEVRRNPRTPGH